jgi:pilus assembly protein CpaB
VPVGAFTSIPQLMAADKGGAPVVLTPVMAREPLLPGKISGPGSRPTVSAEISEGMRAYSFKVSADTGVGGHALPGDRVDVVLMRDMTPQGQTRSYVSYVIVQNARVLGIDLNADPTSEKPATPSTATLELSMADAQKISMAATLGTLSLALRRTGQADVEKVAPMKTADFLAGVGGGGGGGSATPVRFVRKGGGGGSFSGILIIEGQPSKRGGHGGAAAKPAGPVDPPAKAAPSGAASGSENLFG